MLSVRSQCPCTENACLLVCWFDSGRIRTAPSVQLVHTGIAHSRVYTTPTSVHLQFYLFGSLSLYLFLSLSLSLTFSVSLSISFLSHFLSRSLYWNWNFSDMRFFLLLWNAKMEFVLLLLSMKQCSCEQHPFIHNNLSRRISVLAQTTEKNS